MASATMAEDAPETVVIESLEPLVPGGGRAGCDGGGWLMMSGKCSRHRFAQQSTLLIAVEKGSRVSGFGLLFPGNHQSGSEASP